MIQTKSGFTSDMPREDTSPLQAAQLMKLIASRDETNALELLNAHPACALERDHKGYSKSPSHKPLLNFCP